MSEAVNEQVQKSRSSVSRPILGVLALIVMLAVIQIILGFKSSPVDATLEANRQDALSKIALLDARLPTILLRMRLGLSSSNEELVNIWSEIQQLEANWSPQSNDSNALPLAYFSHKSSRQEQIEQYEAILHPLLDAQKRVLSELQGIMQTSGGTAVEALQAAFLKYLLEVSDTTEASVREKLAEAQGALGKARAQVLTSNAEYVLANLPVIDALLLELTNEKQTVFQDIADKAETTRAEEARQRDIYRIAHHAFTALLIVVVLFLSLKLRASQTSMELNVAERTKKLASVYDELKRSQLQMMQTEKMASLGQMVAGIAHEINTPLGYSRSNVELVRERLSEQAMSISLIESLDRPILDATEIRAVLDQLMSITSGEHYEELDSLLQATQEGLIQIGELINGLRAFSRLDRSRSDKVDLNKCVDDALRIAQHTIKKANVTVERQSRELPLIGCIPSQINQVLLNLIVNAAQAMPAEGGTIVIDTHTNGRFVEVVVEDDGAGIPTEILARIFDPFFTTKEIGKGTGLGLSIAHEIMREHGGAISVNSRVGEGTKFTLSFPVEQG